MKIILNLTDEEFMVILHGLSKVRGDKDIHTLEATSAMAKLSHFKSQLATANKHPYVFRVMKEALNNERTRLVMDDLRKITAPSHKELILEIIENIDYALALIELAE